MEPMLEENTFIKCDACQKVRPLAAWREATVEDFQDYTPNHPEWDGPWVCPVCKEQNYMTKTEHEVKFIGTKLIPIFPKTDLDRLKEIKTEKSTLEKEEKKISEKLKDFMVTNQILDFPLHGHTMQIGYQDRSTMNEDKLVELIESKFNPQEIDFMGVFKRVTKPEVIVDLVREGKLSMEELGNCKILNLIPVFNFDKKEKVEKTEDNPFGGKL